MLVPCQPFIFKGSHSLICQKNHHMILVYLDPQNSEDSNYSILVMIIFGLVF